MKDGKMVSSEVVVSWILYEFFQGTKKEEAVLPEIEFTWLPGEYEIQEIYNDGHSMTILITSADDSMMLNCWLVADSDHLEVFTEDYDRTEMVVSNKEAEFFQPKNPKTASVAVWTNQDNSIMFYLSAHHPKEIMLQVAEGIIEKK